MTRDEAREFARIVQAYADGKQIQCESFDGRGEWIDLGEDACLNAWARYRIKPEPREGWMVDGGAIPFRIFGSHEAARQYAAAIGNERPPIVRMREVME
jgi:hypothetical protein